jgi:hypothetical protein
MPRGIKRHYSEAQGFPERYVARRTRFEGGTFEVVLTPSMRIIAQGYESLEDAEKAAETFQKGHTK